MTTCSSHRLPEIILRSSLSCIHVVISQSRPLSAGEFYCRPAVPSHPCPLLHFSHAHHPWGFCTTPPPLLLTAWVTLIFHFHLQRPVLPSNAAQTHSLCEGFPAITTVMCKISLWNASFRRSLCCLIGCDQGQILSKPGGPLSTSLPQCS